MSYNAELQSHNAGLQEILRQVNELPDAGSSTPSEAVLYTEQTLTDEQKAQARQNIGAISEVDVPQKGVDYWTEADQESIVQQVITALGTPVFGRVDADNNIILTGELADGVYTIKYEDAEGNVTEIGTLNHTVVPEPTYKNWIPLSTTTPGGTEIYNGKGYKENTRWSSSSAAESSAPGVYVTGCIPVSPGDVIRLKNIRMNKNDTASNVRHICSWANSAWSSQDIAATADYKPVWDSDGNLTQFTMPNWGTTHIRLNTGYIGVDSILTINEEIPA